MPKNRDYTGLVRTPSSIAWPIRERTMVRGEVDKCEKQLDELPKRIAWLVGTFTQGFRIRPDT